MNIVKSISLIVCSCLALVTYSQDIEFRKVIGTEQDEEGKAVSLSTDGGYYVAGSTAGFGYGNTDAYLIKIDSLGNLVWSQSFGGSNIDRANDMVVFNNEITLAGTSNSLFGNYDFFIAKSDTLGNLIWKKTIGGWNWDMAHGIDRTPDNGYIVVGETQSYGNGNKDGWIVKLNNNGDTLWTKTFGGIENDWFKKVVVTSDSMIVAVGTTESFGAGEKDVYVVKLDLNGELKYETTYGDTEHNYGEDIIQSYDLKNYWIIGSTDINGGANGKMRLYRTDTLGVEIWAGNKGGSSHDFGYGIDQDIDGNIWICGTAEIGVTDMLIFKLNNGGWFINGNTYGQFEADVANDIKRAHDNGSIMIGTTHSFGNGLGDILIVKTNDTTLTPNATEFEIEADTNSTTHPFTIGVDEQYSSNLFNVYPNPVVNFLNIKTKENDFELRVYNQLGAVVLTQSNQHQIDVSELSSGWYSISIITKDKTAQKAFLKVRN